MAAKESKPPEAEAATDPAPPPAGIPLKLVIIIVAGTLILGLGGAFAFFKFMAGGHGGDDQKAEATTAKAAGHAETEAKHDAPKVNAPGAIYDVDPFIVNLADTPEVRYLKLTVKLELESQDISAELASRIPQLRDTILVLLTSKDAASIRTPQGKFQLRDEITQRVNSLLPKPGVRAAYFTDFVVQ
ncbi:MAG: flagellar basal body-associated FliL family protein [Nitrospirota bacterium]|jgi:flagellar protein FliL